jgi:pyrimidine-specific ribonucleoside hydrolase
MNAPSDVVLVVDTGVDDAMALLLALRSPTLHVRGIACVAGNVEVDQVIVNTLRVLDAAGVGDVPLGRGSTPGPGGRSMHGADGMADLELPAPVWRRTCSIVDVLDLDQPYTLLSLAPCTDVAPSLSWSIAKVMAVAGFNRESDTAAFDTVIGWRPDAVVFERPAWQAASVSRDDAERLARSTDPATSLAGRLLLHQVGRGDGTSGSVGDAVAVAALLAGEAEPEPTIYAETFLRAMRTPPPVP